MAKERFVVPLDKRGKRHGFRSRAGSDLWTKCWVALPASECHPVTTNPNKYSNKLCKNCERSKR
jgi:hypothetical protein